MRIKALKPYSNMRSLTRRRLCKIAHQASPQRKQTAATVVRLSVVVAGARPQAPKAARRSGHGSRRVCMYPPRPPSQITGSRFTPANRSRIVTQGRVVASFDTSWARSGWTNAGRSPPSGERSNSLYFAEICFSTSARNLNMSTAAQLSA